MTESQTKPDTIVAQISAPGTAPVAVVRISGEHVKTILSKHFAKDQLILKEPNKLHLAHLFHSKTTNEILDQALVVFFPSPRSFTGEDVLEVHLHGSPYIVRRFIELVLQCNTRLARAGEFSERAFLNGKLDLSQAEAIADIIQAETESQARVAQEQLSGKLSQAISNVGEPLRDLLAEIEAGIDFPEEDINPLTYQEWREKISAVNIILEQYISSYKSGKLYRDGINIVLAGIPNAGKSSILNRLLGEERAIVTPIAGTTRDSIEERISIGGFLVKLWDTAGLANTDYQPDQIEALGIERSWKHIKEADLVMYIFDSERGISEQQDLYNRVRDEARNLILVGNKSDLATTKIADAVFVSAKTGEGFDLLREHILEIMTVNSRSHSLLITNERHLESIKAASASLRESIAGIVNKDPAEFIALLLRSALSSLNEIIGITTTDNILGRIFSKFCIGK